MSRLGRDLVGAAVLCALPAGSALRKRSAAIAGESSKLRRIADHDAPFGDVARDHGTGADHRHRPDPDPRQHDGSSADGRPVLDHTGADLPVGVRFHRALQVAGARMLVVEQAHAGAEEDTALDGEPMNYRHAVLQLAAVANPHAFVDVGALAQYALLADDRTLTYLCLVPDLGARPDLRVRGHVGARMDEDLALGHGAAQALSDSRDRTVSLGAASSPPDSSSSGRSTWPVATFFSTRTSSSVLRSRARCSMRSIVQARSSSPRLFGEMTSRIDSCPVGRQPSSGPSSSSVIRSPGRSPVTTISMSTSGRSRRDLMTYLTRR